MKESGIQFSELEGQVLQFHLSNLEYACGSSLHQVSLRSSDTLVCSWGEGSFSKVLLYKRVDLSSDPQDP